MGGEVVASGAEVGDFAQLVDGAVPPVRGRNKCLKVDELVVPAAFAERAAHIVGLNKGGRVRVQLAPAGVVGG